MGLRGWSTCEEARLEAKHRMRWRKCTSELCATEKEDRDCDD